MELDVARCLERLDAEVEVDDDSLAVDVIAEVGVGGSFLSHEHTYRNFRTKLWSPDLFDRTASGDIASSKTAAMSK